MSAIQGEEKKDREVELKGVPKDEEMEGEGEEDDDNELSRLFGNRTFDTEASLQEFMNENGIGDFRIVLYEGTGGPLQLLPTDQHNKFTSDYVYQFIADRSRWGYATGTHNIHLATSHRELDISFFWISALHP